ncbi:hypothetical protein CU097_010406, partial [Rhizopus azygosporus]
MVAFLPTYFTTTTSEMNHNLLQQREPRRRVIRSSPSPSLFEPMNTLNTLSTLDTSSLVLSDDQVFDELNEFFQPSNLLSPP